MKAAAVLGRPGPSATREREGVVAVLQDPGTLDRVRSIFHELQIDDELRLEPTLDAALRRIREGAAPRVLIVDLSESAAPIAVLSAARAVGGGELKILALGTVNDVGLYRDLIAAGASDYLVKPVSREALASGVEPYEGGATGSPGAGLGQVIAFIGSRGGVGTTTTAVACAWLLADRYKAATVLLDLDLSFGSVALTLDVEPGSGLCEALEQPTRIDALFVERAAVKITENLRVLAAEAPVGEPPRIDAGAIDVLLYELRRKFAWVLIDLPRSVTPVQRVVLGAANRLVLICERSLNGLRDTIRLQALMREQAPQCRVLLIDSGASADRAAVAKAEFERASGASFDAALSHDAKSAAAATNAGQPLPLVSARTPLVRDIERLVASLGAAEAPQRRKLFGFPLG
jgi:pilus assembly protein CpaE